jgi:ribonuclease P protein component
LTQDADPHTPPRLERLRKRWQFLAVAKGRALARGSVLVQVAPRADNPDPSLIGVGFTATKRIGNAAVRNRAKRRLREAARVLVPLHGLPAHDYVVVARASVTTRDWARLLDDMKSALISLAAPPSNEARGDEARPARKTRPPASPRPA